MIKLLLFVKALFRLGPGLVVRNLAAGLPANGFRVTVASLDCPDTSLAADLRSLGIEVIDLSQRGSSFLAVRHILVGTRPDILHTHGLRADILGRIMGRLGSHCTVVSTIHDSPSMYGLALGPIEGTVALSAQVLTLRCADAIVMVANRIGQAYKSMPLAGQCAPRFRMIYNGVPDCFRDVEAVRETADRRSGLIVGAVGRLTPRKGFRFLVEAAARLAPALPDLRYLIVGEGESRLELEASAERLGLAASLSLAGARSDIADVLRGVDIFVLPSIDECLPLAVLEAMSAGKAIVASDVGGVGEAVIPEQTGILVPPGDAGALASAIRRLVEDVGLRKRLGAAARQRYLEMFTVERMVQQYAELYTHLANRETRRHT